MTRSILLLSLPLVLSACAKDTDGDGILDKEEVNYGTDIENPDTDGDGLLDGAEVYEHSSNPTLVDSDGDGYEDGDEVNEGSDPADAESGIYAGGWPYQRDKDGFDGPSVDDADPPAVGAQFPRLQVMDQYGDTFDLYDLAGHGKPVLIDVSAEWCPPCQQLSQLLSTGAGGMASSWGNVDDRVNAGEIYWVTIMGQDLEGAAPPSQDVLHRWDERYPNEHIPVVATDGTFNDKYVVGGWPTVYYLDENMIIEVMPNTEYHWGAMDRANGN